MTQLLIFDCFQDNNVDQLTEGRHLPYPVSAKNLCKKIPVKLTPVNEDIEFGLVGLPIVNKKAVLQVYDRSDNSLALKQFTRTALLSHEKNRKRKIEFTKDHEGPSGMTFNEADKDLADSFECFTSLMNYVVVTSFVDPADKSPLGLLFVGWEMFMSHELTPTAAESLFSHYLQLKTAAAVARRRYPSVQDIKAALSFQLMVTKKSADKSTKDSSSSKSTKSKVVTPRSVKPSSGVRYCQEWNSGHCPRVQSGSNCVHNKIVLQHACNRKIQNKYCAELHQRVNCPK